MAGQDMPENPTQQFEAEGGSPQTGSPVALPSDASGKWRTPEERAAQLRAFGKALAGTKETEARVSQRSAAAEAATTAPNRKLLAGIGGGVAVLILAAVGWFFLIGKNGQTRAEPGAQAATAAAPEANAGSQSSDASSPSQAAPAPRAVETPAAANRVEATGQDSEAGAGQAAKRVSLSTEIANSLLILKTDPTYPPIAKAQHITGIVVIEAVVNRQGTVQSLRVVSGPAMLESAALNAMKSWRYRPYLLNGAPVEFTTTESFTFTLSQ